MRASGASELIKFSHFHILKLLFPSIFWYFVSETFNFRCQHDILHTYTINAVSFYYSRYGAIYKRQYIPTKHYMRASGPSELKKFRYFYILKLLFLSIFCRYIRYFVGTNDMLVGLHVPTNFPMYRQIFKCTDKSPKRHYWGAIAPPPPPPLATLMAPMTSRASFYNMFLLSASTCSLILRVFNV